MEVTISNDNTYRSEEATNTSVFPPVISILERIIFFHYQYVLDNGWELRSQAEEKARTHTTAVAAWIHHHHHFCVVIVLGDDDDATHVFFGIIPPVALSFIVIDSHIIIKTYHRSTISIWVFMKRRMGLGFGQYPDIVCSTQHQALCYPINYPIHFVLLSASTHGNYKRHDCRLSKSHCTSMRSSRQMPSQFLDMYSMLAYTNKSS